MLDGLEVRCRRLRNSWEGTSGRTRRPPAYGGVGGEGVPRKDDPRVQVEAFAAASTAASSACCLLEQRAHLAFQAGSAKGAVRADAHRFRVEKTCCATRSALH